MIEQIIIFIRNSLAPSQRLKANDDQNKVAKGTGNIIAL